MTAEDSTGDGLVNRARHGDERAFATLVARHEEQVFSVALLELRDRGLAREVAQDVFVRAFQHLSSFRGEAAFGTWLHRIAINRCRDVQRAMRSARRREALDREASTAALADPGPERALLRAEDDEAVRRAVARLPDDLRRPLVLRYAGGLRYQQIAQVLGLPLGTVCTRLQRAVRTVGQDLKAMTRAGRIGE